MAEKKATGKAGAAAPPAAGFAAFFFSTRAWAAAESSRSPTSAVADGGDGALVAVLAFRRHDMLRSTEHASALSWRRLHYECFGVFVHARGHCASAFAHFGF